ncbi:uncharacterized protein BO88DRAFT_404117, partial [Aspergillus vadensis CBS 113365]
MATKALRPRKAKLQERNDDRVELSPMWLSNLWESQSTYPDRLPTYLDMHLGTSQPLHSTLLKGVSGRGAGEADDITI